MGDLGLSGPYGVASMQEAVRQRILDQLSKQQQEFDNAQKVQAGAREDQKLQMQQQEHAATLKERQQQAAVGNATKLAPDLPMNQNVTPQAENILRQGGMSGQLYRPPTMADTESGKPFDPSTAMPAVNLGTPGQQKDATDSAAIDAMAKDPNTSAALRGFLRMRSALPKGENIPYQLITEPNGPPQSIGDGNYMLNGKPIVGQKNRQGRILYQGQDVTDQVTPYVQPPTTDSDETVQQGPNGLVVVNKRTGVSRPVTAGVGGAALGLKPTAQMQTHELAKSEAQDTLTQLDQALEQAKDLVGPGQGRVSNVEEIIGSQDPRLNTLGTKMLAAKVKVNAALTPSVRAGMNPAALAVWDNLLANKVTPEGLKATIQAMREIVGKTAASTAESATAGKVRKYNPATRKLE